MFFVSKNVIFANKISANREQNKIINEVFYAEAQPNLSKNILIWKT